MSWLGRTDWEVGWLTAWLFKWKFVSMNESTHVCVNFILRAWSITSTELADDERFLSNFSPLHVWSLVKTDTHSQNAPRRSARLIRPWECITHALSSRISWSSSGLQSPLVFSYALLWMVPTHLKAKLREKVLLDDVQRPTTATTFSFRYLHKLITQSPSKKKKTNLVRHPGD